MGSNPRDEHRALYVSGESLDCTPETSMTLGVNQLEFQLKKIKVNPTTKVWLFCSVF